MANNPRSIAGITSLYTDSAGPFFPRLSQGPRQRQATWRIITDSTFSIHQSVTPEGRRAQAIKVIPPTTARRRAEPERDNSSVGSPETFPIRKGILQLTVFFAALVTGLGGMVFYYRIGPVDARFQGFMNGQTFSPRFLFTSLGLS